MAKQSIVTESRHKSIRVHGKDGGSNTATLKSRGIVNVPPHVRIVQGKPVLVAGYTYRRK